MQDYWIKLAKDYVQWSAIIITVMNLHLYHKKRFFFLPADLLFDSVFSKFKVNKIYPWKESELHTDKLYHMVSN